MCGYRKFFPFFGKKPNPFLPITAPSKILTLLPTTVFPYAEVPLLIVTNSRIITLLPISVCVSSPSYFKSWGISPIELL